MTRRPPEDFEGKQLIPLCVVSNLSEAKKVEAILDEGNIDYTFQKMSIASGILSFGIRDGIAFLVIHGQLEYCQDLLKKRGLSKLLLDD